jgi:glycerol-3-phosphate acyltransferase PlsY
MEGIQNPWLALVAIAIIIGTCFYIWLLFRNMD